jgi:diguanylate cyclase (GGDEF)-like protein
MPLPKSCTQTRAFSPLSSILTTTSAFSGENLAVRDLSPMGARLRVDGSIAAVVGSGFDPDFRLCRDISAVCPVILIAEDESFSFRLCAARAGVEAVLTPPLDLVELGVWLGEFDTAEDQTLTILVVDDDDLAAQSGALALRQAGMSAHIVTDPSQVLGAIRDHSPDLVILDMHMPGANGIEVARIIRQSRRNISLPIVFLSAERDRKRQQAARRIGGDDFITKPVDHAELTSLVRIRAERAVALRQVMERDSLTGLLNHARFKDRLQDEVDRTDRTGSPLSVCLIDLDHFKHVNDSYGHQAGDRVIQTLARSLSGRLRKTDVVARYGGEEFAAILLDTPVDAAEMTISKICRAFAEVPFGPDQGRYFVTLSAGISSAGRGASADQLMADADKALYRAKSLGRDRVVVA